MRFLIAFATSLVLVPLVRRLGHAAGLVDSPQPGELKIHAEPVPITGGVAVVAGTLGAVAVLGWSVPGAVLGAVLGSLAFGLVDDARPQPVVSRIVLQAAAGGLVAWAIPLEPLGAAGGIGTVLLVMASTNAVNLLDGQDGLVGGLGAIAAFGLAAVGDQAGAEGAAAIGWALAGALAGFLVWNRAPAKIFLGNGGAYAVGAMLAALAAAVALGGGVQGLLAAGACLGVFAFELFFTVVRRLVSGASIGTGDRRHSYDLVTGRIGRTRSTLAFWMLGGLCAVLGVAVQALPLAEAAMLSSGAGISAALAGYWLWSRRADGVRQPQ